MTLITEGFTALANASAKARGMANLPIVSLHRDLEYLPEDKVRADVDAHFDEIVTKLEQWKQRRKRGGKGA